MITRLSCLSLRRSVVFINPRPIPTLFNVQYARLYSTQPVEHKKPTLIQRYEGYLERNWPKAYKMHRLIVDGCKECVSDVKTYYFIRRDLNAGKTTLSDLSRQQLEVYIQTKNELPQLVTIVILAPLPFAVYFFAFAIIFFPRHVLTRHFWSDAQKKEYWRDAMDKVAGNHFAALVSELPPQKHIEFPVAFDKLKDIKVTPLDGMTFTQLFHLSRVHRFLPISGLKNLRWRAEALRHLDNLMYQDLSQIEAMDKPELRTQLNIRGLNFEDMDKEEMKSLLKSWITTVSSIAYNPSLYLHSPVLLQYDRKMIEQARSQDKDHKI